MPLSRLALGGTVAAIAAVVLWLILPLVPMDEDAWFFFALARWFQEHIGSAEAWTSLFTEYFNPREPIYRPVTNLWFGVMWMAVGSTWWAWMMLTVALHVAAAWLVARIGTELGMARQTANLAGLLWAVHPLQSELLGWVNAQETQLMTLLMLTAVWLHQRDRVLPAALVALAAMCAKEQGLTVAGAIVLVDLVVGRRDPKRWVPVVTAALGVLALRALVLAEPANAFHSEYTTQFVSVPIVERLWGLLVVAPAVVAAPVPGAMGMMLAGFGVVILALGYASGGADGDRKGGRRWLLIAALWLFGIVLPASADLVYPEAGKAGLIPSWNLRHLYPALAGPCWLLAVALARLKDGGWVAVGAVAALGCGLVINLQPYAEAGARARAVIAAIDGRVWAPEEAVRVVEPLDPVAAALQYRPLVEPSARTAPTLIGEPRCGCVRLPPNPDVSDVPTIRKMSERFFEVHVEARDARSEGNACGCEPWRKDARWLVFDGRDFVEDGPE